MKSLQWIWKASYFLPLWKSVSFGKQVPLECFNFNQSRWKKKKRKKKLVKSYDRISGHRFINSFRKCPIEQNMHRKEALCHSKSYFMSLKKQVNVYIHILLSVLFWGSQTAKAVSLKSPQGKISSYWRWGIILNSPHPVCEAQNSHLYCYFWCQQQRPHIHRASPVRLWACKDEQLSFVPGGAHSLAGTD